MGDERIDIVLDKEDGKRFKTIFKINLPGFMEKGWRPAAQEAGPVACGSTAAVTLTPTDPAKPPTMKPLKGNKKGR